MQHNMAARQPEKLVLIELVADCTYLLAALPIYTAWWQSHTCVCGRLDQGCTRQRGSRDL